jgi:hypothetical protein
MDVHQIITAVRAFIIYNPFISIGIAAAIGILIYIKPKEVLRLILIFLGICLAGYLLYYLWEALQSGYLQKGEMINKSL